eukprot:5435771-Prymnesium_polylepis.1
MQIPILTSAPPKHAAQEWSKAEVLAYRANIDRMDDTNNRQSTMTTGPSRTKGSTTYGWYPALPYHACYPDMLHMALN